jgi:hypothetical protein
MQITIASVCEKGIAGPCVRWATSTIGGPSTRYYPVCQTRRVTCAAPPPKCWVTSATARAVEPLVRLLDDTYWWTRVTAVTALGRLHDRRAVDPIRQWLAKDPTDSVREQGQRALWLLAAGEPEKP